MIAAGTYGYTFGVTQFSSSAYYWRGLNNNLQKLGQSGPVVEASWLSGYTTTFSGSNLSDRPVGTYMAVTNSNRFIALPVVTVIAAFIKRALLIPNNANWNVWS